MKLWLAIWAALLLTGVSLQAAEKCHFGKHQVSGSVHVLKFMCEQKQMPQPHLFLKRDLGRYIVKDMKKDGYAVLQMTWNAIQIDRATGIINAVLTVDADYYGDDYTVTRFDIAVNPFLRKVSWTLKTLER